MLIKNEVDSLFPYHNISLLFPTTHLSHMLTILSLFSPLIFPSMTCFLEHSRERGREGERSLSMKCEAKISHTDSKHIKAEPKEQISSNPLSESLSSTHSFFHSLFLPLTSRSRKRQISSRLTVK